MRAGRASTQSHDSVRRTERNSSDDTRQIYLEPPKAPPKFTERKQSGTKRDEEGREKSAQKAKKSKNLKNKIANMLMDIDRSILEINK